MSARSILLSLLIPLPLLVACGGGGAPIAIELQLGNPDPWPGVVTVTLDATGPSMAPIHAEAPRASAREVDLSAIPYGPSRTILVQGLDGQRIAISRGQSGAFDVSESGPDKVTVPFTRCGQVYRDADGDGHGTSATARTSCTAQPGWVSSSDDCDDQDANVHPGQTQYFTTPTKSGGWDYDCDKVTEKQYADTLLNCTGITKQPECVGAEGWEGTLPGCGEQGQLGKCDWTAGTCGSPKSTQQTTQACR